MSAPAGKRTPQQRARMTARLGRLHLVADDDEQDPQIEKSAGSVAKVDDIGSLFDWREGLYLDADSGAQWDGGDQQAYEYRQMLKAYAKARMVQRVLTGPIKGATWKLKPGQGDSGEAADTEEKLRRPANGGGMTTPMQTVIGQITSAFTYRRAYFVKRFMLDRRTGDGSVLYKELAMRPASTCRLRRRPDGSYDGFEQDVMLYGNDISRRHAGQPVKFTPRQSFVYIHGADEDPVSGVSDLEIAFWCWRTQQKILFLWLNFLEAQALPRTMVKHQGDEAKARAAAQMIARTKSTGVAYFDGNEVDVSTLDVSGRGPQAFLDALKYLDSCVSGSVLAGFTDLTSAAADGKGSLALSSDQSDFFLQSRIHAANAIASDVTNYVIADLVRYNYGTRGAIPTFEFDPLAGVDDQPVLTLLQALAPSRANPMPNEFVDMLAIEAARVLHLDVDKLSAALTKANQEARAVAAAQGANPVGQDAAGMNAAMNRIHKIARGMVAPAAAPSRPALPAGRP